MSLHIMLDLETMSRAKDAAIISIGARKFNPEEGTLGDSFYVVVNLTSAQRAGGSIEANTIMWWLGQSEEARKTLLGDNTLPIETALKEFSAWVREKPIDGIWGNGSGFDNVVLENTYARIGWTPPWAWYMNRCYRTMKSLTPNLKKELFILSSETLHNALADATIQARHLCAIWKELKL